MRLTEDGLPRYDNGQQMATPFRLNYAGYLPLQQKIAVYLSELQPKSDQSANSKQKDSIPLIQWEVINPSGHVILAGVSGDYRFNDFASGDSFYLIDFSELQQPEPGYKLRVNGQTSSPFTISNDPYGAIKYEFFDYFQDHERRGDVFDRAVDQWTTHSVTFNFIADAGDQGYYPVNAAEAQWALINLIEAYPQANAYYANYSSSFKTVYDQLVFMSDPMDKIIFPGETLAAMKFATYSNGDWAPCPGARGNSGNCISKPETKATYSVARTLAAMARLHQRYGRADARDHHYQYAQKAFENAEKTPVVCVRPEDTGGEGGYYPNNDNWSLWRDPRSHRDPCAEGPVADPKNNNLADDQYAALVELYLTATNLQRFEEAKAYKKKIEAHDHHNRVDTYFFGAVSPEGTLSLLVNRPKDFDLTQAEQNLFAFSDKVLAYQTVGYPGITFDVQSDFWDNGDNDDVDNNFRWASNRMQLNDARILMMAADIRYQQKRYIEAAKYTNGVLRVLDQISGTNAVALAMYTAHNYPNIEHAVTRTHDALVPDTEDGKLALGPNNWTNSNDPDMPAFGSQPGMKMFSLNGTGWASREIAIDGNAAMVPVMYFATEVAPRYLEAAVLRSGAASVSDKISGSAK